ncbi:MAG: GIY-YIG nuclease family protein [Candidatus Methanomethylophilaceae archaeon]|nr:GIY-YIG nuclease family protein [Candidatus Methanomethylophilaceae archaeon]
MSHGKSIRLFLIEGESSGRWKCELSNWTGLAYKIPRNMLSKCSDRLDLDYAGVYFLIGKSDDQVNDKVYIGESEDVLYRLNQHVQAGVKEWQDWSDCVVFISKDNQLNKAMIKYLESSLYDLAAKADRAEINNANRPRKSSLSELDAAEMDEYLDNLRLLMGALGYKFLEPSLTSKQRDEARVFSLSSKKSGYDAKGTIVDDGFLVYKGSKISDGIADSFQTKGYNTLRERLISEGVIVDRIFVKDYLFSSYSAASSVVEGHNSNGWVDWKDESGKNIDIILSEISEGSNR